MTSDKSRHPGASQSRARSRFLAYLIPAVLLTAAALTSFRDAASPVILALLFLATASAYFARPGFMVCVAAIATGIVAGPTLAEQSMPDLTQGIAIGSLWITALMLGWNPSSNKLRIEELQGALADSPNGLLITDLKGRITHANEPIQTLLNTRNQPLVGTSIEELLDRQLWQSLKNQEGQQPVSFAVGTNAGLRTLQGQARLTRNRFGRPAYYVIQVNDLTREKSARRALSIATRQLRRILGKTSDIVFVVDANLQITYANNRALDVLGARASKVNGQLVLNFVTTSEKRHFIESLNTFRKSSHMESTLGGVRLKARQSLLLDIEVLRLGKAARSGFALICHPAEDHIRSIHKMKNSQARFSQVFHASPDAILILRARDSLILDFNDGFTRLLGYRREDAIGVLESDSNLWANPVERDAVGTELSTNREVTDYETTLRTKAGEVVHVEISLRYIEVDNELCILCIGRDITKRISAEAALVETEEKFEKVFTQSPDGIIILRQSDGVISDLNDAFIVNGGFSREELIGQSLFELPVFEDATELREVTQELSSQGVFANRSITLKTKTGKRVPTLVSGTLLELSGEGYVMCLAKDMSTQQATEERLRRSEERFRGIFENAPIGILLVDIHGSVSQANRCAEELLAYGEGEMEGLHLSRLVPSQERKFLKESLAQLEKRPSQRFSAERRMICQNGLEIWTNFHVVLQESGRGQPLYYIVQIADITDLKVGQQRMEQMAFYDTLTNLANRRLFHERLTQSIEHTIRSGKPAALLYLDLDNFKRVNDTLGHDTGDALLREVAGRLKQCVRKEDTVARPGGDEFTILLSEVSTPSDAGMVAEKILTQLREPIRVSGHPLVITTSIGITLLPTDGVEPNVLTRNADLAMYKAKERGRNNYQFYSEDLNTNAIARLRTEYEIRQALDLGEFVLFYQPKVSLKTQRIVGVECLVRWKHPARGLIGPQEFIEVAEETGCIIDIGTWVIDEACRAAQSLNEDRDEPVHIAINISPRQFRDPNLVTTIRRGLREMQLSAEQIELEITETMLMQDVDAAEETVRRLGQLGVKLAIDDFGTGYSSLNYLKKFPINTVKVDKSFVMDIPQNQDDMAITRPVIAMAHQLKLEVVAEGVETREQLQFLVDENCEYAQGYLFSEPLTLEGIEQLLDERVHVLRAK